MGLISTHVTLLVIYSLRADTHTAHTHHFTGYLYPKGKYTHTHPPHTCTRTHTHTNDFNDPHRINFKKPGVWSACAWFKSKKQHSCSAFSFYACNTNTMHIRVESQTFISCIIWFLTWHLCIWVLFIYWLFY